MDFENALLFVFTGILIGLVGSRLMKHRGFGTGWDMLVGGAATLLLGMLSIQFSFSFAGILGSYMIGIAGAVVCLLIVSIFNYRPVEKD